MRTVVDSRLLAEAQRFELRFACEDCVHFEASKSECLHEYPTTLHRRELLRPGAVLAFCKEFEISE